MKRRYIRAKACLLFVVFSLSVSNVLYATQIIVDADGPADYSNIQSAIDAAFHGDEIIVADGTYSGPGNREIDFHGKNITLRSENGPESTIIALQGGYRGFLFQTYNQILCCPYQGDLP